jgi:hypothetical protein
MKKMRPHCVGFGAGVDRDGGGVDSWGWLADGVD